MHQIEVLWLVGLVWFGWLMCGLVGLMLVGFDVWLVWCWVGLVWFGCFYVGWFEVWLF